MNANRWIYAPIVAAFALAATCSVTNSLAGPPAAAKKEDRKPETKKDEPKKSEEKKGDEKKADDAEGDPLAKIFGEGGFTLNCEKAKSEIDAESNELKFMHMEGDVHLKSQLMNLDCADVVIDMEKKTLIAVGRAGKPVEFVKDDIEGVCGKLVYDIDSKRTNLEGPPQPFIKQKDKTGKITQTTAQKITMIQGEKSSSVLLEGKAEIKSLSNAPDKKEEKADRDKPKAAAEKIDAGSTDKIPSAEPKPAEKIRNPASIR